MFEKVHSFKKAGMEILSIHIKATKSTWLDLYNVYLPNTSTQHNSFDSSLIKPSPSSIILGDLNGHSQLWDSLQPYDQRGDEILDWILDNDLHILNDGSATRTSRITGNDSTPRHLPLWEQLVSEDILETSRAYWQLWSPSYHNQTQPQNLLQACHPKIGSMA